MTPRIGTPSLTASSSRIRATSAAPSLGTSPSAARWKGRDCPVGLTAPSSRNPRCTSGRSGQLTAPATMRLAVPSRSRSQPSLIAYSAEAQAASRAKPPAPRPSARAAIWAGRPEENRLRGSAPGDGRPSRQICSAKVTRPADGYDRLPSTRPASGRGVPLWPASRRACRAACRTHRCSGSSRMMSPASIAKPVASNDASKSRTSPPPEAGSRLHRPTAMFSQKVPGSSAPGKTQPRPTIAIGSCSTSMPPVVAGKHSG